MLRLYWVVECALGRVLMAIYSSDFLNMIQAFLDRENEFEQILPANIAQFILESGRGLSNLAIEHKNFAGMKWRKEMKGIAHKKLVKANTETAFFCSFDSVAKFAEGYWVFLDRPPYKGWRDNTSDPEDFIDFIAPIWAADVAYSEKLKDLLGEASELIERHLDGRLLPDGDETDGPPCCNGMDEEDDEDDEDHGVVATGKPDVIWDPSPYRHSRAGTAIDTIVMHYTTTRSLSSTRNWFKDPDNTAKTSIHYLIGRDGTIVQMVKEKDACIHGNSQNKRSIGIEHSAAPGDRMTASQEAASGTLIRWLMNEYGIKRNRIIAHKCAPRSTKCPGDLFKDYGATSSSNCETTRRAIQEWLDDKVL